MLPPLRERRTDIPALAASILSRNCGSAFRYRLTPAAELRLMGYDYPGNIRELRNILLKAAALSSKGVIGPEHILLNEAHNMSQLKSTVTTAMPMPRGVAVPPSMIQVESQYIADLLDQHNGHRRTVADILGISERTLYRKLNRYQLNK